MNVWNENAWELKLRLFCINKWKNQSRTTILVVLCVALLLLYLNSSEFQFDECCSPWKLSCRNSVIKWNFCCCSHISHHHHFTICNCIFLCGIFVKIHVIIRRSERKFIHVEKKTCNHYRSIYGWQNNDTKVKYSFFRLFRPFMDYQFSPLFLYDIFNYQTFMD